MNTVEFVLGVLCGVVTGFSVVALIALLRVNKMKRENKEEMQSLYHQMERDKMSLDNNLSTIFTELQKRVPYTDLDSRLNKIENKFEKSGKFNPADLVADIISKLK